MDNVLQIQVDPRPDPLGIRRGSTWTRFIPAGVATVLCSLAVLILPTRDLGLVACGAAAWAVVVSGLRASFVETCYRFHLAAGLFALAIFDGAAEAGAFAPAAALLLILDLLARQYSRDVRRSVAPMAGSVPWRFRSEYRQTALRAAAGGAGLALVLAVAIPHPIVKIVSIACLPIALRAFGMNLMSGSATRSLWMLVAFFHAGALAAFVPAFGAEAAAWIFVVSESMLLVGIGLLIARRTGVTPFPMQSYAVGSAASLLLCALAIPKTGSWPVLIALVCVAAAGAVFWPNRSR